MPVPQSSTSSVPSVVRISTHEVFPPYFAVRRPGVGIEPRVPQNRTCINSPVSPSPLYATQQKDCRRGQVSVKFICLCASFGYTPGMLNDPNSPRYDERPWGSFTVLDEGPTYKVKRIEVLPQKRLSYQKHSQRAEHWMVVAGAARVTLDGREIVLNTGETVDIPIGSAHRIENTSEQKLVFIEIQRGSYLGEDDIQRLQDDFGRTDKV